MKKCIILFSLFWCILISIDGQVTIHKVNLETQFNHNYKQYILHQYRGNYNKIKDIPFSLSEKNSLIRYAKLGVDTLFILLGDIDSTKRVCIMDANKNLNFSDDYIYSFNKEKITEKTHFPPQLVTYRVKTETGISIKHTFLRPVLFDSKNLTVSPDNDLFHKYFITIAPSESYEGIFYLDNKTYKVIVLGDIYIPYMELTYDISDSVSFNIDSLIINNKFKSLSEKTLLNNYLIDNLKLTDDHSTLTFDLKNFQQLNTEEQQGYEENFYAIPFVKKDINGKSFSLKDYKGQYVLLDFWGTWCNPCIALLPHIAKIHKKYPDLQIVSVAYETDDKGKAKIPEFVKKYEMDWVNICDINGKKNSINTLFMISSYPTTILIAPDGKIIHRGSTDKIQELDEKQKRAFM